MDLEPVIARLKSLLTGFKSIGSAVDLDAAIGGVVAAPAAFVMPLSDSALGTDIKKFALAANVQLDSLHLSSRCMEFDHMRERYKKESPVCIIEP